MFNVTPDNRTQLKGQLEIPAHVRGMLLVIRFAKPIPIWQAQDFYRIQLSKNQMNDAEGSFFMAELWQPHRAAPKHCMSCGKLLYRLNKYQARCSAANCAYSGQIQETSPARGVIKVVITEDMVDHKETKDGKEVEFIRACCLVLDRRYNERTLVSIRHQAGRVSEIMGWEML